MLTGAVRAKFNAEADFVIVEGQLLWHIGVVGIVASRLVEKYYLPAIVLTRDRDGYKGSARSIRLGTGADLEAADDILASRWSWRTHSPAPRGR